MGLTSRKTTLHLNCYDCDSCKSTQAIFQPADHDVRMVPKGWLVTWPTEGTVLKVKCPSCCAGVDEVIEGRIAENHPSVEDLE